MGQIILTDKLRQAIFCKDPGEAKRIIRDQRLKDWLTLPGEVLCDSTRPEESRGSWPWLIDFLCTSSKWRLVSYSLKHDVDNDEVWALPGELVEEEQLRREFMAEILEAHKDRLDYVIRSPNKVKVLEVEGKETHDFLEKIPGLKVDPTASKWEKRASQPLRPCAMGFKVEASKLRWQTIEDPAREKELDGGIWMPWWFVHMALTWVENRMGKGWMPDHMRKKIQDCQAFNGRLFVPGLGLVKGQFFLYEGDTIITHRCNIKRGIEVEGEFAYWIADPQPPKSTRTSNQFLVNNRNLFPVQEVLGQVKAKLDGIKEKLLSGEWVETHEELWDASGDKEHQLDWDSHATQTRVKVCEVVGKLGLDYRSFPALAYKAMGAHLDSMLDPWKGELRVEVPNSVCWQVVSAAFIRLVYPQYQEPERRHCRFHRGLQVVVRNTEDYVEVMPDHGGPDMDDFYTCMVRGNLVWFLRSPNDVGEYSMAYLEEDTWLPEEIDRNYPQIKKEFPWPTRRSKLPPRKPLEVPREKETLPFGVELMKKKVMEAPGIPGNYVNAVTALVMCLPPSEKYRVWRFNMEEAIDICTQLLDPGLMEEVSKETQEVVNYLVRCQVPLSKMMMTGRGLRKMLPKEVQERHGGTNEVWFDQMVLAAEKMVKEFQSWLKTYLKENYVPIPKVEKLKGMREEAKDWHNGRLAIFKAKQKEVKDQKKFEMGRKHFREISESYRELLRSVGGASEMLAAYAYKFAANFRNHKLGTQETSVICDEIWPYLVCFLSGERDPESREYEERMAEAVGYMPLIEPLSNEEKRIIRASQFFGCSLETARYLLTTEYKVPEEEKCPVEVMRREIEAIFKK